VQAYGRGGRTPPLVADVVVRPADRGETVVHCGGRWIRGHGGTHDRIVVGVMVVPTVEHHRCPLARGDYDVTTD